MKYILGDRVEDSLVNKTRTVFDYELGADAKFILRYLPEFDRYETEGWAGYDGYIRTQFDNFEEAYEEFNGWVEGWKARITDRIRHGQEWY